MLLREITTPVTSVPGIGSATAKNLAKLNIFTVADLLTHYPREWEDRTKIIPLKDFNSAKKVHTLAKVLSHEWFGFGRMKTLKIIVNDGHTTASLLCFNRPFMEKTLPPGSIISLTGSFQIKYGELQSSAFSAEVLSHHGEISDWEAKELPDSKVFPVYPLTSGITIFQMRKYISKALKIFALGINDELPPDVIETEKLMHKCEAIKKIHEPDTLAEAQNARHTLIFEELYLFQENIIRRYFERHGRLPQINLQENLSGESLSAPEKPELSSSEFAGHLSPRQKLLLSHLSFALTKDQMYAILDINADIDLRYSKEARSKAGNNPLNGARLLQGDVGSGKTLVAFFGCLRQIDYGGQCALLAPTEMLAKQHADNAASMLEDTCNVKLAFLTGNIKSKGRNALLSELKEGRIDIVIGTHALFSQGVVFNNLKFVVIDEQHRFGVIQRNAIIEKGRTSIAPYSGDIVSEEKTHLFTVPSLLMMSATPIPRTLALSVYGDLDVTVIKTMPKCRLPIQTHLTKEGNEKNAYEAVREELKKGHQAYFVYPLIEQSDEESLSDLKSAEESFAYLSEKVYKEYKLALVHSQVDEDEQQRILRDFKDGSIDILVATSVVEVGIDVPNASCMVIEHAERFGLAALHQLRGRVGRSGLQSHCFLIYSDKLSEKGKSRLKALYESTDGFYIAEQDMLLRGPGEVTGIQQSGNLLIGIADPIRDSQVLLKARAAVIQHASYAMKASS